MIRKLQATDALWESHLNFAVHTVDCGCGDIDGVDGFGGGLGGDGGGFAEFES